MEALAKSDIFFVLTGIAVIIVTFVILVTLYYVIKILRNVEDITDAISKEGKEIIDDIHSARTKVKKGGKKISRVINPFSSKK